MTYELVKALCECPGIPGRERPIMQEIARQLEGLPCERDALGNMIVTVKEPDEGAKDILFEAHADRIGFVVTGFEKGGFVRIARAGGMDPYCAMGTIVSIETKDGSFIPGAVGAPFPYPAKPHNSAPASEYKIPEFNAMFVDCGLADPAAAINLGASVLIDAHCERLLDSRVAAPALDDRACCAALILAARELQKTGCANGVKLLFSTREETGGQGAKTGSFAIEPDISVALDVGFAISPDVTAKDASKMGGGPEIDLSAMLDEELPFELERIADEHGIKHQRLVLASRSTGTDADELTVSGSGRRTGLISIPIRYMHHGCETADLEDIENTAKLIAAFAREVR